MFRRMAVFSQVFDGCTGCLKSTIGRKSPLKGGVMLEPEQRKGFGCFADTAHKGAGGKGGGDQFANAASVWLQT